MQKELNYTCDVVSVNVGLRPIDASKAGVFVCTVVKVARVAWCGCDKAR